MIFGTRLVLAQATQITCHWTEKLPEQGAVMMDLLQPLVLLKAFF